MTEASTPTSRSAQFLPILGVVVQFGPLLHRAQVFRAIPHLSDTAIDAVVAAAVSVATFAQVVPKRDMLYLDKAWPALQALTRPTPDDGVVRAAYRMFEGDVTMHDMGWDPWVRTILPEEVPAIRDDLCAIGEARLQARILGGRSGRAEDELRYTLDYLRLAQGFTESLAMDGRGFVYLIG